MRKLTDPALRKTQNRAWTKNEFEALRKMTDQLMFQEWTALLRPLFPSHAEYSFKPRKRVIGVNWVEQGVEQVGAGETGECRRSVIISFTHLAWKGYRGARSARRSRADQHLVALVNGTLAQYNALAEYEPTAELQIVIASVDLFPPPASAFRQTGQSLLMG